jgi:hypothetical protein
MSHSINLSVRELAEQLAGHVHELLRSRTHFIPAEYLTPEQVHQLTGFTPRALEAMRAKRVGPAFIKLGTARSCPVRYRLVDIRTWLDKHRKVTTDA